jgi:hypothetical protein
MNSLLDKTEREREREREREAETMAHAISRQRRIATPATKN